MEIRQLELFVATCEEHSFTAAARRCGVAQSALSARIADLERELGAELVDRSTRPIGLTRAGQILLDHAWRILSQCQLAAADVAELRSVLAGRLRLGMINVLGFSSPETEAALAYFHQLHPMVEIVVSDPGSRAIVEGVRSQQFDLGFVGLRPELVPKALAYRLIANVPVVAVVPANHVHADRPSVTLRELVESGPSIDLRQGTGLRHEIDVACARAGLVRESSVAVSTTDEAIRYAALGFGFTLLPRSAVDLGHRRPNVAVLPLRDTRITHPVALIHPVTGPVSPAARALVQELELRVPRLAVAQGR
jgi:DNA-binding transcriptional LysR family regulator